MGKTAKERMQAYRARLNSDPEKRLQQLEKERTRDRERRLKPKTCNAKVAEREKTRQRVAKCRERKKELNNTVLVTAETYTNAETPKTTKIYDRPQSLGKAVCC